MEGNGTTKFADGAKYVGEYKANLLDGYGEITYANETIYKGYWKNGNKHGKGRVFDRNNIDGVVGEWNFGKKTS